MFVFLARILMLSEYLVIVLLLGATVSAAAKKTVLDVGPFADVRSLEVTAATATVPSVESETITVPVSYGNSGQLADTQSSALSMCISFTGPAAR